MKSVAVILIILSIPFMVFGAFLAHKQHRLLKRAQPVSGTVIASRVVSAARKNSTVYRPAVVFRYVVRGRVHTADTVFPLCVISSSNRRWAESIVADFPPGKTIQAYYDPLDPGRAFLVRRHDFAPYLFILIPLPFLCVGAALLALGWAASAGAPVPVPAASGWFEVLPTFSLAAKQRAAWIAFGIWDTVGLLTLLHYAVAARPPYETAALVAGGMYFAVGGGGMATALYFSMRANTFLEARVFINRTPVVRGAPVTVAVRQKVREDIFIEQVRLGVVRHETIQKQGKTVTRVGWEEFVSLQTNQQVTAGQPLETATEISIPESQPPTTPATGREYTKHDWSLRLIVKVPGRPDYRAAFPILVM